MSERGDTPSAGISILYIGAGGGTALDRANALRRLGHHVDHLNLRELLPRTPWIDRVTWKLGGHILSPWIMRALPKALGDRQYDLCCVDSGDLVSPDVLRVIRRHARKAVNYNIDDPFGKRDVARFAAYRRCVPLYDLCVVVRAENVAEAHKLGARDVLRVFRSSDEDAHAPRPISAQIAEKWHSEVLFLGTWFPERGPFLAELIGLGVPLTIRGSNWSKAPEWSLLRSHYKGGHMEGDDYAFAIQCARVSLGLLSKGNRDLHTTRSLEIPSLGGLLCAERTPEHIEMYVEGVEALFWDSARECAAVCRDVLRDEERRRRIAEAGHARSLRNRYHNEDVMQQIIARTFS